MVDGNNHIAKNVNMYSKRDIDSIADVGQADANVLDRGHDASLGSRARMRDGEHRSRAVADAPIYEPLKKYGRHGTEGNVANVAAVDNMPVYQPTIRVSKSTAQEGGTLTISRDQWQRINRHLIAPQR